jgi:hypothetical protein
VRSLEIAQDWTLRAVHRAAPGAVVEGLAGVRPHHLELFRPADRARDARDDGLQNHADLSGHGGDAPTRGGGPVVTRREM